jgi:hypothetical protein
MHQIKPELRRQDLEGIHLSSFRISWKLKSIFLFLNHGRPRWNRKVKTLRFRQKKSTRRSFFNFQENLNEGKWIPSISWCRSPGLIRQMAYFRPFSNVISIKTARAARKKYLHRVTSLQVLYSVHLTCLVSINSNTAFCPWFTSLTISILNPEFWIQ